MSIIQGFSIPSGGYNIDRSLRFNSADSAYLNRTPASAGNRRLWTYSFWVKRSALTATGSGEFLIRNGNGPYDTLRFDADFTLQLLINDGNSGAIRTSALFRDVSAWYHVVIRCETSNATTNDRLQIYANNVRQSLSTNTQPSQNYDTITNTAVAHGLGGPTVFFSGLMTEVNFIDGQALTPSSFGETDPITGVWKPKKYTGTYGTNGFYLNFSDNSGTTSTTLGKDYSGNGNNWTPNNFSVTAGAGNDSLVDVPTLWGSDTGAGGEVRGNYATLNPLLVTASTYTFSNGNLDVSSTSGSKGAGCTISVSSGKWYWEQTITAIAAADTANAGIRDISGNPQATGAFNGGVAGSYIYRSDGFKRNNGTVTSYGTSFTTNDVIGVALDLDAGTLVFYKNGVSQGTAYSSLSGTFEPVASGDQSSGTTSYAFNFGQRAFAYAAPSGFKALCTTNLPEPTIKQGDDYFNAVLWTGTGANRSITGVGFQPDLVWIKSRSIAGYYHVLTDSVRGTNSQLFSNDTLAQETRTDRVTSFDSDGFSLGVKNDVNDNGSTFVGWCWKANGTGVTNTAGTITSTVSANTTSGFSIVTYTGTGANATVGHGLGAAPKMIIFKNRTTPTHWPVVHTSLGWANVLYLSLLNASASVPSTLQSTAPTSTLITLGTSTEVNQSTNSHVAYCFAPVAGFSAFGSYTGNGSTDGTFVFTGFRPRYVMIKNISTTGDWWVVDTARSTVNVASAWLNPNLSNAESSAISIDLLSNGFKFRSAAGNDNGQNWIYATFAENPFKYALAR